MWRVLKDFADFADDGYVYHAGDLYPRKAAGTNDARVVQLMGRSNKCGVPLIEPYKPEEKPPKKRKSEE